MKKRISETLLLLFSVILLAGCSSDNDYDFFCGIKGIVTDYETGEPLQNVSVLITPGDVTKLTDKNGEFVFENLDAKQYMLTAQKSGYQPNRKNATAVSGETVEVNIPMSKIPQ